MRKVAVFFFHFITVALAIGEVATFAVGSSVLPLSGWVYREDPPQAGAYVDAPLSEGFEAYEGKYLKHEIALQERMYTFRIDLSLEEEARGAALAIFMGPGDYPRDVYLNGVLLLRTGAHGARYNATVYYSSRITLPPQILKYGAEPNRIAVESFPAYETSPLGDFSFGDYYAVTRMVFTRNLFNVHLVQAADLAAIIIAIFFFSLFLRSPAHEAKYLWFSLVCVSFALGYVNMSLYDDAANDLLLDKASRIGLPLTSLFLAYFAMSFTGILNRRPWPKILLAILAAVGIVATSIQKDKQGLATAFATITTNFMLTPVLLFILALLVIALIRHRSAAGIAVLGGYLAAIGASIHDLWYIQQRTAPFCYLVAYGYLALLVSIFFVLSLEQARLAADLARNTESLDRKNGLLGEMVGELTGVAEGLVAASSQFESTLGRTITEVEGYETESRRIAVEFGAQVGSLDVEVKGIAARLGAQAERTPRALEAQVAAVERVDKALAAMSARMEESRASAVESNAAAAELARGAKASALVIDKSRAAMSQAFEHSGSLETVLASIEDIAERTHVLSINAAIESARLGSQGKGFAVVAQEIRNLSDQSRDNLASSFSRIGEMTKAVSQGSDLSSEASRVLVGIVGKAEASSERAAAMLSLVDAEKTQSEAIFRGAAELLEGNRALRELSAEESRLGEESEARFRDMRASLAAIGARLAGQGERGAALGEALGQMKAAMAENAGHLAALRASIEKALAATS